LIFFDKIRHEEINKMSSEKNFESREWVVRHIPVRVKGRSKRPYRIPKLWISVMLGAVLYLAVHLSQDRYYNQNNGALLRRGERDLGPYYDYSIDDAIRNQNGVNQSGVNQSGVFYTTTRRAYPAIVRQNLVYQQRDPQHDQEEIEIFQKI
jgi:uncharacterized Fe-S cluster-containing MiaB family protein